MTGRARRLAPHRWLLVLSAAAFLWGVVLLVTGGFVLHVAGWRLSSTQAARPIWIGVAAFVVHYLLSGVARLRADLAALGRATARNGHALAVGALVGGLAYGTVAARACGGPPDDYKPLPIVDVAPSVLDDAAETYAYLNAFPLDSYAPYNVRGLGRFWVDNQQDMIKRVIVSGRPWEPHVLEVLERHVEPATVVLEVGAHIGTHTMAIARLVGPWGRVYAFEPQRKIFRELHHNLALNGVTNVVALRFAIGSGEARIIEMNPATPGNEGGTGVGAGGDRAELRSLDSFEFEQVSLIKIDVEGYENEVLDGAVDTIRRNRPVVLLEILGGVNYETASPEQRERIEGTWKKLERLGYTVTPVFNHDYLAQPRR